MGVKKVIVCCFSFFLLAGSVSVSANMLASTSFLDDGESITLRRALDNSIRYLSSQPPGQVIHICQQDLPLARLLASLQDLAGFLDQSHSSERLADYLAANFSLCRKQGSDHGFPLLVTGYYQPVLQGSLKQTVEFDHPLYRLPADKKLAGLSRAEIENSGKLKGYELIYLADPVSAFILHIQGSGLVSLGDGGLVAVNFAGTNGMPYTSIGALLARRGVMELSEITMPEIVNWLQQNPSQGRKLMEENRRFVFFELADHTGEGPTGSMGYPLVAGRSVALDRSFYPLGLLALIETMRPVFGPKGAVSWHSMRRLVCHQDSGAAIKGPDRLDLFWGRGADAGRVAGMMKHPGSLFLLLPR